MKQKHYQTLAERHQINTILERVLTRLPARADGRKRAFYAEGYSDAKVAEEVGRPELKNSVMGARVAVWGVLGEPTEPASSTELAELADTVTDVLTRLSALEEKVAKGNRLRRNLRARIVALEAELSKAEAEDDEDEDEAVAA